MLRRRISPEFVRAARYDIAQRRRDREVKFAADRDALQAAYDADIAALDAELAEVEIAEKVHRRWSASVEAQETVVAQQANEKPATPYWERRKDLVLAAVQNVNLGKGASRQEIESFLEDHGKPIPGTNISVYLARLKAEGKVAFDGSIWTAIVNDGSLLLEKATAIITNRQLIDEPERPGAPTPDLSD